MRPAALVALVALCLTLIGPRAPGSDPSPRAEEPRAAISRNGVLGGADTSSRCRRTGAAVSSSSPTGFSTYTLASGREGTIHLEQILEYNKDPDYLRDRLLYQLTLEVQRRVARSRLSRREIIRRLGTSAAQFYRLLDQTNYSKSVDQLVSLLQILDCDVEVVVRAKTA